MDRREAIKRTAWLMGGVVSASAMAGVLKGCTAKPSIDWKPEYLTEDEAGIVSQVAEIIIPKTDTPGAKDVGVPSFIDNMLKECYKPEDQERFRSGLKAFNEAAEKEHGDPFLELDEAVQLAFTKKVHDEAVAAAQTTKPEPPRPFILMTKELTMLGFFTSEPGATQVLQYEAVPGRFDGCIPVGEAGNGKTWAS